MSKHHTEIIKCPHCGTESEFTIWDTINAELDPLLKEKVLRAEIYRFTCPECGAMRYCTYDFLYHDTKSKVMIFFLMPESPEENYETGFIPQELLEGYTLRVVRGYDRLIEKILIFDSGLRDVAVERMKYMISHFLIPEVAQSGYDMYFREWEPPTPADDKNGKCGEIIFDYRDHCRKINQFGLEMEMYYEQEKAVEIDPRMKADAWDCVDQEWMDLRIRRIQ